MGPKTLRRDAIEPKTSRRDVMEPKTLHRDALQSKTPRRVNPFSDEFPITSGRDKQRCDQIYNEFELVGGDDEELEDVPWRKPKSNQSKNQKSDDSAVSKTPFDKWFDSGENQAKKQTQLPTTTAAVQEELLLDENFPNVKPTTINKSTFGFSGCKPVKLSMEGKNKKPETSVSEQHVFALDDSPERSSVRDNRVLDDDVVIVSEDIFSNAPKQSTASKQAPLKLQLSENKQIPVLGAGVTKPIKSTQMKQINPRPSLPAVPAAGTSLATNQMYRPPYVETYPPKHDIRPFGVSTYIPPPVNPSVGPPAEYFIGTPPVAPVPPVTRLPINNFNTPPPSSSNWIPLTNPTLPSPLQAGVAPPLQRPTLSNPPTTKAVSTPAAAAAPKDAVKDEMQEQNRTLLMQKQEYVGRLRVLTEEMVKLKSQRKIISRGRKMPEKDHLQKENKRLQIEVQSKITAVENVIDMLSNMIVRNGGDPKTELENTVSQKEATESKDKSQKLLPTNTKKITRDRYSRSRSSSRHRTRSRSPRDRRRILASRSRSRSRSRRRSRSKHRSSSRSPHDQRSRRSRSQKRDYEGQHTKSITVRKNRDQKSSSPTLSKTALTTVQTNPGVAIDTRRETFAAIGKREEPTKTSTEYQNKKLKMDSSLAQTKIDERTKMTSAETNALEQKATSEASRQKRTNYVYYDSETHWCRVCNVFPQTAKEYLTHLHSVEHKTEMTNRNMVDYPWHKVQPEMKKTYSDAPTKRVPIRGLQFFVSATAWYCKLCDVFMGDLHCASVHLKSDQHEQKLSMYSSDHPSWEDEWLKNRTSAYEEYSRKICDSQADEFVCAPQSTLDDAPKVSTAPVTVQPSFNSKESRAVNSINGDTRSSRAQEDELKKRPVERLKERSKSRERSRGRSRDRSRGRTRDRNHSRGRYRSRDRDQSRDREYLRGRDRSSDRDYSRGSSDQLDRRKYDKSVSASKYHESKYSRQESNFSKESRRSSNDNAASGALIEANANDDEFVREWIPPVRSTGKEKELADLRDKLRRTKENERKRQESDKKDECRASHNKRHADRSPVRDSGPDETCAKTDSKSESHPPPVKMQPIIIGKTPRFPFIGKMPSKSYRKSDSNVTPTASEMVANIDEKFTELEKLCVERAESEPDLCNTVVDMDVNDVEDAPIVMEVADEIAVRKKDFDETLKILYPKGATSEAQSVPSKSTGENYLLSLVRSTVWETMKQLPNQKESLDPTAVVSLVETMSKKLLTVSRKAENDAQPHTRNDRTAIKSNETSRYKIDSASARERVSKSKSTVPEMEVPVNEPASRNKKGKSMSVRAKLEEQEKQLQEKIDEKRRILEIESIPTPPENDTARKSIPIPEPKTEILSRKNNDDSDLFLLGIEEGDSAALQF